MDFISFVMFQADSVLRSVYRLLARMPSPGSLPVIGLRIGSKFGPDIIVLYVLDRAVKSVVSKLSPIFRRSSRRNNENEGKLPGSNESS